jgi:hypothetical protein
MDKIICADDYKEMLDGYKKNTLLYNGQQPGDPAKIAEAIADVVRGENFAANHEFPDILPFSEDNYNLIKSRCESTLKLIEEWKEVIVDVNFDE